MKKKHVDGEKARKERGGVEKKEDVKVKAEKISDE